MDKYRRISKTSLLWPRLNTYKNNREIRHDLNEKFSVFSSLIAIKKIFQLNMNNSVNYDNVDSIKLIKFFVLLIEGYEDKDMEHYITDNDKKKIIEAKKRLKSNSNLLNTYFSSNLKREFNKEYKLNFFTKTITQLFVYPAYLDIYNYGDLIVSR